jgi:hypothetical protein
MIVYSFSLLSCFHRYAVFKVRSTDRMVASASFLYPALTLPRPAGGRYAVFKGA